MQDALLESEVPALLTLDSASEQEVEAWIVANHLQASPLIIKPPMSAGSDKVFYIEPGANWRPAFQRVLTEPTQTTGIVSQTAVVQERAIGQEYAVGTVSANGKHHISHIIRYTKASAHGRDTLFDYVEFIAYDEQQHGALIHYVRAVLDALGIRWGATHTEIIVTERGPRLIDFGARMCEGPVVEFSRAATGSSQADRLAEAILQGSIAPSCFTLKQTVRPVFLRAPLAGILRNAEIFDATDQLPTLFKRFVFFENGQRVPQTVDYMTSLGIIALAGEPQAVAEDYKTIRNLEAQLQVSEH
jgi:biotin carboxylase